MPLSSNQAANVPLKPKRKASTEVERELAQDLASFTHDPLGAVMYGFPWGVKGGPLENFSQPEDWQMEHLIEIGRKLKANPHMPIQEAIASGHGIGKAHPKSLVIETPDGQRSWGDLKIGDQVWGANGEPTTIVAVHERGVLPVFMIAFDDGSTTRACGDHLWSVKGRQQRRCNRDWVVMSTTEIAEVGTHRANGKAKAKQWEIPRHNAVSRATADLPIHPYTLGAWLGDGGRRTGRITSCDIEVINHLRAVGEDVRRNMHIAWGIRGLQAKLRALGLEMCYSYEKAVPTIYRQASAEQRAELLRGLLDTDGETAKHGSIVFSSCSKTLAEDVVWLARSLGGKARLQPTNKLPWFRGADGNLKRGRVCYRATLTFPAGFQAFYITRKQERVNAVQDRYLSRWFSAIEPDGEEDCSCITVAASDSLYLANDFIVTHNSADLGMVLWWAMSTHEDTRCNITAGTDTQLRTKTAPEVAKWFRMAINAHWFVITATAIYAADPTHEKSWRCDFIPWNEKNPEAVAGLHNQGKRIVIVYDEASQIPEIIWETQAGALTDANTEILWLTRGNPTRNTGRFKECFGRYRHRWYTRQIDSRTVSFTNKAQIQQWVEDYGEDSDFVRVRVRGDFPRAGSMQFIPSDLVDAAMAREPVCHTWEPLILGCDVARYGDDQTVIAFRRGRDAATIPWVKYRNIDTMTLASEIARLADQEKVDAIFIDGVGIGAGVVDRLRQLKRECFDVQSGGKPSGLYFDEPIKCKNKRVEMWAQLKQWLRIGAIPDDMELEGDLTGIEYGYDADNATQLERVEDMKKRGLASPDNATALALTFAEPVAPKSDDTAILSEARRNQQQTEYDPYGPNAR